MDWPRISPARRVFTTDDQRFYDVVTDPGDYCLVTVREEDGPHQWVYFLLPVARDGGVHPEARSLHGVRQPPHTFRECADGSLEIRASIGCGKQPYYWHGYLDEGNIWRQLER